MLKVGIIGCGAIGTILAKAIEKGDAGECRLVALFDRINGRAKKLSSSLRKRPQVAETVDGLLKARPDLVIEAASQDAVKEHGEKVLGKADFMVMSVGSLLDDRLMGSLTKIAKKKKRRIYVPSGAICGIDGVKGAGIGKIKSAQLTTRKPPKSLGLHLKKQKVLYNGPASKAVKLYPRNINVAATLSLAGIGKKKTRVKIIADPSAKRSIHEIRVKGEFGELVARTENVLCPENPKTSYIAALSAVRTVRNITEVLGIGT